MELRALGDDLVTDDPLDVGQRLRDEEVCRRLDPGGGALFDLGFELDRDRRPGGERLEGGAEAGLLAALKRDFAAVRHVKPPASRKDSAEMYLVATGFRGSVRL